MSPLQLHMFPPLPVLSIPGATPFLRKVSISLLYQLTTSKATAQIMATAGPGTPGKVSLPVDNEVRAQTLHRVQLWPLCPNHEPAVQLLERCLLTICALSQRCMPLEV